jgi:hypothetical protein
MKIILFLLILLPSVLSAQVAVHITGGVSTTNNFNGFIGAELQGSNVSVTASWNPVKLDSYFCVNGFSLMGSFYLWPYQTSPFFTLGVITHGNYDLSEVTGKPIRSMPIAIGYRIYPSQYNDRILENLSFDIAVGIEITESTRVYPYAKLTANFIITK